MTYLSMLSIKFKPIVPEDEPIVRIAYSVREFVKKPEAIGTTIVPSKVGYTG